MIKELLTLFGKKWNIIFPSWILNVFWTFSIRDVPKGHSPHKIGKCGSRHGRDNIYKENILKST